MAIEKFKFTKLWTNPADFPAYESDETQVRADMQCLHDETKDYLNNVLLASVDSAVEELQEWVVQAVADTALGNVPDLGVGTSKLQNSAVTRDKLASELRLPAVSDGDNGAFLRVAAGQWSAVQLIDAGEEEY